MTSHPDAHALGRFQDRLHRALEAFLNGSFVVPGSRPLELLRRLRPETRLVPWDILHPPTQAAERLVPGGVPPDISSLVARGRTRRSLTFAEAAAVLAGLHHLLDQMIPEEGGDDYEVVISQRYDDDAYRAREFHAVRSLARYAGQHLAPYTRSIAIHGSLSTLDYTPYSDLDDFLVVRADTVLDPARLQACAVHCIAAARFLYEHDPLQHHRHYAVTELDLRHYSELYLPLETLRFATRLTGVDRLLIRTRSATTSTWNALQAVADDIARWADGRAPANLWELKTFASLVLLVPALYLEVGGAYRYKRFSFDLASDALADGWKAVEIASEIRNGWAYRPGMRERLMRWIVLRGLHNPALFEHLMTRWAPRVPSGLQARLERAGFRRAALELVRTALGQAAGAETPA